MPEDVRPAVPVLPIRAALTLSALWLGTPPHKSWRSPDAPGRGATVAAMQKAATLHGLSHPSHESLVQATEAVVRALGSGSDDPRPPSAHVALADRVVTAVRSSIDIARAGQAQRRARGKAVDCSRTDALEAFLVALEAYRTDLAAMPEPEPVQVPSVEPASPSAPAAT